MRRHIPGHPNAERKALLGKSTGIENPNNADFTENKRRKQKAKESNQREVNMSKYYPPAHNHTQFNCPYCNVFAEQYWTYIVTMKPDGRSWGTKPICIENAPVEVSTCVHCKTTTFWLDKKIIYPPMHAAPPANEDLPDNVKEIYDEAANIANQSSRAACAMLRLAIEMLLIDLGETGSINDGIKNLVKKGLDVRVQQSLDIVRVTGNNAVHPGEIVFDDTTNVHTLFQLINIIADVLITQPKQIQATFDNLPEGARKSIKKRDT